MASWKKHNLLGFMHVATASVVSDEAGSHCYSCLCTCVALLFVTELGLNYTLMKTTLWN